VEKRCRHCGVTKDAALFRLNQRTRDGLSSWCSECHNEASRRSRAKADRRRREAWEAAEAVRRVELNKRLREQDRRARERDRAFCGRAA
jgi:hypothetical protein